MTALLTARTLSAVDMDYVQRLVRSGSGIVLDDSKAYLVHTRLEPVVRRHRMASVADLIAHLRQTPSSPLRAIVVQALTINETSFFRDVHPWRSLAEDVLPDLIARRAGTRTLTLWSAACSTGQEPYSLAMLLHTAFPQLHGWDVRIVATDLSEEVLAKGRSGSYAAHEVRRGLPTSLLERHMAPSGDGWQMSAALRSAVTFRSMNLTQDWPAMPPVDLMLLRNVLIYFDVPTKQAVLRRARQQLAADGFLLLGGAESPAQVDDGWVRDVRGQTAWFRPPARGLQHR